MDTKALYERLDAIAEALERDGGTHGTDELVSVLTDVLGLVSDGPGWALDPDTRKESRGVVLRWLRDGGHIPRESQRGVYTR